MTAPSSIRTNLVRLTIGYAMLVGGLPVLQGTSFISGGWTESRVLLAVFLICPLIAAWLIHKGLVRAGAIVLLGFMSSGVIVNGLLLEQVHPPDFAAAHWVVVLRVWILLLLVVNVAIAWLALQVLREIHRTPPTHDDSPSA